MLRIQLYMSSLPPPHTAAAFFVNLYTFKIRSLVSFIGSELLTQVLLKPILATFVPIGIVTSKQKHSYT